jgi:hypothetical protein
VTTQPTLLQQITYHRQAISELAARAAICDVCGQLKSAAHWRTAIASCESAIRACERRMTTAQDVAELFAEGGSK